MAEEQALLLAGVHLLQGLILSGAQVLPAARYFVNLNCVHSSPEPLCSQEQKGAVSFLAS